MPRLNARDLQEELETGDGGSPYMGISDEDWEEQEREMMEAVGAESDLHEVFECSTCRDSGLGLHPGMYCSCRFGGELRSEELSDFQYDDF
jgi:hypothetical protein